MLTWIWLPQITITAILYSYMASNTLVQTLISFSQIYLTLRYNQTEINNSVQGTDIPTSKTEILQLDTV